MLEHAAEAGLDGAPGSRLWRVGPAALARLRRGALRGSAEAVAATYNVHRAENAPTWGIADALPGLGYRDGRGDGAAATRAQKRAAAERTRKRIRRKKQMGLPAAYTERDETKPTP